MEEIDYPRFTRWALAQPWAIMPQFLAIGRDLLAFRNNGGRLSQEEIRARIGAKAPRAAERYFDPGTDEFYSPAYDGETGEFVGYRSEVNGRPMQPGSEGVIAVLAVIGPIMQRPPQDLSGPGGASIERLTQRFRGMLNDPAVKGIVFDHDSPGGGVYGVQELAEEIRASRGRKPMAAVANSLAASASYWLFSQVDPGEAAVTPSGEVGSIGVYGMHEDISAFLDKEGVKVTLISAGENKTLGNPFEPLSDKAREEIQARVDDYARAFDAAVSKGRGVSTAKVRSEFGQGLVFGAKDAVARGMADRVATLDETVRRVGKGKGKPAPAVAAAQPRPGPTDAERLALEEHRLFSP